MKINLTPLLKQTLTVFAIFIIVGLAFCGGQHTQKASDQKETIHDTLKNNAVKADKNFDSLLTVKTHQDELLKLKSDTIQIKNKINLALQDRLNKRVNYNVATIINLTDSEKKHLIDSIEALHPTQLLTDYINAPAKDSLLKLKDQQIALDKSQHLIDSTNTYDCGITLSACQKANKANKALAKSFELKHPKLKAFWDKVKQPFEIVFWSVTGTLATKGAYDLYYQK